MRKMITGLAAVAFMATGGVVAAAPAASADTPVRVTQGEYGTISRFDAKTRVHRVFDTSGELISQAGGMQSRVYAVCGSEYGRVNGAYERFDGRFYVESKNAYWGQRAF